MNDTAALRKENKILIFQLMRDGRSYTKQQIAVHTGLSVATCNTLLNEMASDKEVIGEKQQLQSVGRHSSLYRINENYENYICIWFEMIHNVKYLNTYVVSFLGNVVEEYHDTYDVLDERVIVQSIERAINQYVTQVIVGTPSLVEDGIIRHCDITELENVNLNELLYQRFKCPVVIDNDMHYRILGFYKEKGDKDGILTLANFPSHVLPGTSSIHRGELIGGYSGLAGMVGFLPNEFNRQEQMNMLTEEHAVPIIINALVSVIAMINPDTIVLTGDLIQKGQLDDLLRRCAKYIPKEHLPKMLYEKDTTKYYLSGMYEKAIELRNI